MSLCLRKSSIAVARRTLGRNNSVATQSDLGVSCRRDSRDHGSRRGSRDQSWSGATYEEVVRSSYHVPVTVKTMELRHRENKDKIKIRYPFTRSRSRPRLKHKINLQMEKNEAEVADRGEI